MTDYGCGIPEEVQGYLFKDSLTTKSDGNNLGLLSCKGIIKENHQGKLWFETELGKGTTFDFTIQSHKITTVTLVNDKTRLRYRHRHFGLNRRASSVQILVRLLEAAAVSACGQ